MQNAFALTFMLCVCAIAAVRLFLQVPSFLHVVNMQDNRSVRHESTCRCGRLLIVLASIEKCFSCAAYPGVSPGANQTDQRKHASPMTRKAASVARSRRGRCAPWCLQTMKNEWLTVVWDDWCFNPTLLHGCIQLLQQKG